MFALGGKADIDGAGAAVGGRQKLHQQTDIKVPRISRVFRTHFSVKFMTRYAAAFHIREDGVKSLVGRYWTPLDANGSRRGTSLALRAVLSALSLWHAKSSGSHTSSRFLRIHYDRVYSADLRIALKDIGSTVELVDTGQGFLSFAPLVSNFIEAAVSGKVRHGGHPVLTAAVMGAAVVTDAAGGMKVDKGKSEGSAVCRVDPAVAAIMAAGAKRPPAREFMMTFI